MYSQLQQEPRRVRAEIVDSAACVDSNESSESEPIQQSDSVSLSLQNANDLLESSLSDAHTTKM